MRAALNTFSVLFFLLVTSCHLFAQQELKLVKQPKPPKFFKSLQKPDKMPRVFILKPGKKIKYTLKGNDYIEYAGRIQEITDSTMTVNNTTVLLKDLTSVSFHTLGRIVQLAIALPILYYTSFVAIGGVLVAVAAAVSGDIALSALGVAAAGGGTALSWINSEITLPLMKEIDIGEKWQLAVGPNPVIRTASTNQP